MSPSGDLVQDFHFVHGPRALHVVNAPSPGATSSLAIGQEITLDSTEEDILRELQVRNGLQMLLENIRSVAPRFSVSDVDERRVADGSAPLGSQP